MSVLAKHDPLKDRIATRELINETRDRLESIPIPVAGYLVDCDEISDKRMKETIDNWDFLQLESITWIMANNEPVVMTKAEMESIYTGMRQARVFRGAQIHRDSRLFKNNPATTERDLIDWQIDVLAQNTLTEE